ncbi:MAG: hypothetical protein REI64_17435 [Pedobacter sp.]|uniref:hypothetical protein n=1 Tax=Pedobacter sp. TaxID=1411316 RepID=UPI00280673CA|nr:hypothetical protein [Pedobacter sp.]MDQ8006590.1 hypothetical protein [Pedobacter sp.]
MFRNLLTAFLVPLSILIPIGVFLRKYKFANKAEKTLFFYLITAGIINAVAICLSNYGIKNLFLLHIYTIIETIFFLLYFFFAFHNSIIKRFLLVAIFVLPLLFITNFLFLQSINEFNTYTRPLEAIMITAVSLLFLYRSGFVEDWLKQSSSWINIGILVYFPAATLIFILSNYFVFVTSNRQLNRVIWDIHSILVLAMYLAFAKAFSLIKKNTNG